MDASRSVLGNTHPDTVVSITNMGRVLQAQGDGNNANLIWLQLMIRFLLTSIWMWFYFCHINRKIWRGISLLSRGFGCE